MPWWITHWGFWCRNWCLLNQNQKGFFVFFHLFWGGFFVGFLNFFLWGFFILFLLGFFWLCFIVCLFVWSPLVITVKLLDFKYVSLQVWVCVHCCLQLLAFGGLFNTKYYDDADVLILFLKTADGWSDAESWSAASIHHDLLIQTGSSGSQLYCFSVL